MALDFGKLNFSTSFNPTSAFPIDARSYFESLEAAQAAAATAEAAGSSNTTYYFGQILTVNEGGAVAAYQITNAKALQKLASTTSSGDLAGDVAELQSKVGALETAMDTAEADIADIKDGTVVVGKATADAAGNDIAATYETKANVTALAGRVTTAEGEIDTLQSTVGEHTTDIAALEANVGTLQTTVGNTGSGLVKDVNDLKTQIGGLSGAMHFVGTSTTDPEEGTVTIEGKPDYTPAEGDVVLYGSQEFVYSGDAWQLFGDEGSYVLKTTTVNGKPLSANVTLNASDVEADPAGTAAGLVAGLDVAEVAVNAGETIATISETDGKIAVTKQAIAIEQVAVNGLTGALAAKADATAVEAVEGNVTSLQNSVANIESNVSAIQGAGYQTAAQVNALIANATIEASKINGVVANAGYATQAGALINSITLNVAGTEHQFNGGEAVSVNITAAGLGALTSVPVATNEALGGIKVGFTSAGENYAVQLDANNAAYVTVPVPEVPEYTSGDGILVSDHVVSIADNGVTTAKIADNAVTDAKIVSINTDKITQGAQELILNGGTSTD